jgi:hypothetical protein
MSSALAIAAVTATLRNLLDQALSSDVSSLAVTTRPPDKARENISVSNQINLFLYHTAPNAAWRNRDLPQVRPGETGQPPLALTLYYLLTAYYGDTHDDIDTSTDLNRLLGSHRLMGQAMRVLHDHSNLTTAEINAVLPPADQLEHPYDAVERVRITPQVLSLEEMSKLWATFQTQYRISAAYEVSVVLIESRRPTRTPLPVLRRGLGDQGVQVQASLLPPVPTLTTLEPPNQQPSLQMGDVLIIRGHHLAGTDLEVHFSSSRLPEPLVLSPLAGTSATEIRVQLPNDSADWVAGFYTLTVALQTDKPRSTNALPLALAPRITTITPTPENPTAGADLSLRLAFTPSVRPEQRVVLLFGDQEIAALPRASITNQLDFLILDVPAGEHFLRLRIDGVDSLLVNRAVIPPAFDQTQKLTIPE